MIHLESFLGGQFFFIDAKDVSKDEGSVSDGLNVLRTKGIDTCGPNSLYIERIQTEELRAMKREARNPKEKKKAVKVDKLEYRDRVARKVAEFRSQDGMVAEGDLPNVTLVLKDAKGAKRGTFNLWDIKVVRSNPARLVVTATPVLMLEDARPDSPEYALASAVTYGAVLKNPLAQVGTAQKVIVEALNIPIVEIPLLDWENYIPHRDAAFAAQGLNLTTVDARQGPRTIKYATRVTA